MYKRVAIGHPLFGRAVSCPVCDGGGELSRRALWDQSGVPEPLQADCTFGTWQAEVNPSMQSAVRAARAWGEGDGPPFLILAGATKGIGKTHLAVAAAGLCIARQVAVLYTLTSRLLSRLRDTQRPDAPTTLERMLTSLTRYPALILDEFGRGIGTDWAEQQLFDLIDARYMRHMRTLFVGNCDPDAWDDALRSRLLDKRHSRIVACAGRDYRTE